ncbi:MAG: hypothetical protein JNL57_01795 [Bacteroidetes bacterium]|nr:hypothetical protein [Bacteroidota bacterium]
MITQIKNPEDVSTFAKILIQEGVSFHPDDDFESYINFKTGLPLYTPEEAQQRDMLMNACFTICEENGIDIYDHMLETFLIETKMAEFIPLPSLLSAMN